MSAKNKEKNQPNSDLSNDHKLEDIEVGSDVGLLSSRADGKKLSRPRTQTLWCLHGVVLLCYTILFLVLLYRATPSPNDGLVTYCKLIQEVKNIS